MSLLCKYYYPYFIDKETLIVFNLNDLPLDRIRPTGLWTQTQAPITMTSMDLYNLEKTPTRYGLVATINSKMMTKTGPRC